MTTRCRTFTLFLIGLLVIGILSACNFGRNQQTPLPPAPGQPTSAPPAAQATSAPPGATEQPTEAAQATAAASASATDELSTEIDQGLNELDQLNATADPLDDQP